MKWLLLMYRKVRTLFGDAESEILAVFVWFDHYCSYLQGLCKCIEDSVAPLIFLFTLTGDDIDLFDMEQFKSSFKKILQRALKNVTVSFRDAEENSVWIRIAWGTQYKKPNQYKPAYVVYYSQTPYAFTSSSRLKSNLPLLGQALTVASKHHQIVKMDLRSRYLDSLKAIVFKQYNQSFETHNCTTSLQEGSLGLDINSMCILR